MHCAHKVMELGELWISILGNGHFNLLCHLLFSVPKCQNTYLICINRLLRVGLKDNIQC